MGATNMFSEAAWELQMAFIKPLEKCTYTDFQEAFEKQFVAPMRL
jgi:hypothetical protein